ncbi:hypothetical protein GC173_18410 [bacterium]|nr:hypothetical protein [bacterium]
MNRSLFSLLICIVIAMSTAAHALTPTLLDPAHVRLTEKRELMLISNRDHFSPVVKPALGFTFNPSDPKPKDGILRIVLDGPDPAEVEVQARYADGRVFLFTRRLHIVQPGPDAVLWRVADADQLSTVTMTLRSDKATEAKLVLLAIDEADSLTFASRIMAESPTPLRLLDPITPVRDGKLHLTLQLPRGGEEKALGSEITIFVDGTPYVSTISTIRKEQDNSAIYTDLEIPVESVKDTPVSIYLYDDSTRRPVAEFKAILTPAPWKGRVIADQSAGSVAAIVRNGELAVYTVTAPPGVLDSPDGIPHPGETIWLSVTSDFDNWVTEQPVLRSRRDNPALAGGPGNIAVAAEGSSVVGVFDVTAMDGTTSLYVSSATNSLRMVPISANPFSERRPAGFRYAGHGLMLLPKGRLLLSLGIDRDFPSLEARAGNQLPNWLSLGTLTTPEVENMTLHMAGFSDGNLSVLLLGRPWSLYTSNNPLFAWKRYQTDIPQDVEDMSLVAWNGEIYYVGITRRNGFGILRWGKLPVTLDQLRSEVK